MEKAEDKVKEFKQLGDLKGQELEDYIQKEYDPKVYIPFNEKDYPMWHKLH